MMAILDLTGWHAAVRPRADGGVPHRPVSFAGSLYAVPAELRLEAARLLTARGWWVHGDVIVDDGQVTGVPLDTLREIAATVPGVRLEVHVIEYSGRPAGVAAGVAAEAIGIGPDRVVLDLDRCRAAAGELARAAGVEVWAEIPPGTDTETIRALTSSTATGTRGPGPASGALVMLIRPGTRDPADPDRLAAVRQLSPDLPVGIDGGVTRELAELGRFAGATHIVVGRAVAGSRHPQQRQENDMSATASPAGPGTPDLPDTPPARMRASVLTGTHAVQVEERPVPDPPPGEVLIQVGAVGVCGSDVHYYREGRIGDFVVEAPLVLGHEVGGRIVATGDGVDPARVGERVAVEPQRPCRVCGQCAAGRYNLCPEMRFYATPPVDGAFAEYITAPSVFAHAVPDVLSDEAAALLEPLSVGIASVRRAGVVPGSRVLIAGAGPIGIITTQAARAFGAREVVITDPVGPRRERALGYGATTAIDPTAEDVAALGLGADAFIDASGAPAAIASGIRAVRPAGSVVLVGLGAAEQQLPVSVIQDREINLTGVFRYTDTWPLAAHLVASGQVELDSLVTGRYGLDQVAEALESDTDPASLKSVVYPGRES